MSATVDDQPRPSPGQNPIHDSASGSGVPLPPTYSFASRDTNNQPPGVPPMAASGPDPFVPVGVLGHPPPVAGPTSAEVVKRANLDGPIEVYMHDDRDPTDRRWSYVKPGAWSGDTLYSLSVNDTRVLASSVKDDHPQNALKCQALPLRYLQSISMSRWRALPGMNGFWAWLWYQLKRAAKGMGRMAPWILPWLMSLILILLLVMPESVGNIGVSEGNDGNAKLNARVNALFATVYMLLTLSLAFRVSKISGTWAVVGLATGLLSLVLWCMLIAMAHIIHNNGTGSGGSESGNWNYSDNFACKCYDDVTSSVTATDADPDYAWTCTVEHLGSNECYQEADCGFCGDPFRSIFIASVALALLCWMMTLGLCWAYIQGDLAQHLITQKTYYMWVELHGSTDYGYPAKVALKQEDAMEMQNHVYGLMKANPDKFTNTAKNHGSSNVTTLTQTLTWPFEALGDFIGKIGNFLLIV